MTPRTNTPLVVALLALCACAPSTVDARDEGVTLSPETVAALEARIEREGEGAAEALVGLVVASPVALPGGELDRLGRLLIDRSDDEHLTKTLRTYAVVHPDDANLNGWLTRLEDYERTVVRGVDVLGY